MLLYSLYTKKYAGFSQDIKGWKRQNTGNKIRKKTPITRHQLLLVDREILGNTCGANLVKHLPWEVFNRPGFVFDNDIGINVR